MNFKLLVLIILSVFLIACSEKYPPEDFVFPVPPHLAQCANLSNEGIGECHRFVLSNISLCHSLNDTRWKNDCYATNARYWNTTEPCDFIGPNEEGLIDVCYSSVATQLALVNKDMNYCNITRNWRDKDNCLWVLHIMYKNDDICNAMEDYDRSLACLKNVEMDQNK